MAILSITIPNDCIDLLAKAYGYQSTVPNPAYDPNAEIPEPQTIANPQNKGAFLKERYISQIKDTIHAQKRQEAILAANIQEADIS